MMSSHVSRAKKIQDRNYAPGLFKWLEIGVGNGSDRPVIIGSPQRHVEFHCVIPQLVQPSQCRVIVDPTEWVGSRSLAFARVCTCRFIHWAHTKWVFGSGAEPVSLVAVCGKGHTFDKSEHEESAVATGAPTSASSSTNKGTASWASHPLWYRTSVSVCLCGRIIGPVSPLPGACPDDCPGVGSIAYG